MKVIIQTPGFNVRKKLTNSVKANVMKLSVFGDRIHEAHVVLKLDKSDTKDNKICELRLAIPGNDLFAEKQSSTFEDAASKCVEAIKHQISRWKDSVNNGKLRGSAAPIGSEEASM
ncbi:MAG: HPF/RaiA family ribosome-associated protein [Bacteroidota bacterium]